MNSSEVFALRQLLSRLEAPTKTIGRELLMTEAGTSFPRRGASGRAQVVAGRCRSRFSVWTIDVLKEPTLCSLHLLNRFRGRVDGRYWRIVLRNSQNAG